MNAKILLYLVVLGMSSHVMTMKILLEKTDFVEMTAYMFGSLAIATWSILKNSKRIKYWFNTEVSSLKNLVFRVILVFAFLIAIGLFLVIWYLPYIELFYLVVIVFIFSLLLSSKFIISVFEEDLKDLLSKKEIKLKRKELVNYILILILISLVLGIFSGLFFSKAKKEAEHKKEEICTYVNSRPNLNYGKLDKNIEYFVLDRRFNGKLKLLFKKDDDFIIIDPNVDGYFNFKNKLYSIDWKVDGVEVASIDKKDGRELNYNVGGVFTGDYKMWRDCYIEKKKFEKKLFEILKGRNIKLK